MCLKLLSAFFLTACMAAFATQCPAGGAIIKKGIGINEKEASDKADAEIAREVNSRMQIDSEDFFSQVEENGNITDKSNFSERAIMQSVLENRHAIKHLPNSPYKDKDGNEVSERYICVSDAALPYLDSLRKYSRTKLNAFELQVVDSANCAGAEEAYAKMLGWQRLAENLKQMDKTMQAEYEATYAKIKNECSQTAKRGVYLETKESILGSKSEIIKNGLEELISNGNCKLEEKAKGNSINLKIEAKDCNYKHDDYFDHCGSCSKIDLADSKNKENNFKASIEKKGSWDGKKAACEKAAKLAVNEIWSKVAGKLNEVCQ